MCHIRPTAARDICAMLESHERLVQELTDEYEYKLQVLSRFGVLY